MTLEKQVVTIPLVGGVETKLDAALVGKDKLLTLENFYFARNGSLKRREGNDVLVSGQLTTPATQAELFALDRQLCCIDSDNVVKTYSPARSASNELLTQAGQPPVFQTRKKTVSHNRTPIQGGDVSAAGGVALHVWIEPAVGVCYCVIDTTTGAYLIKDASISGTTSAKYARAVVASSANNDSIVIVYDKGSTSIFSRVYVPAGTTIGAENTLVTDLQTGGAFETQSCPNSGNSVVALAYVSSNATYSLRLATVGNSGSTVSATTDILPVATCAASDLTCLAIASFTATKIAIFVAKNAAVTVYRAIVTYTAGTPALSYGPTSGSAGANIWTMTAANIDSSTVRLFVEVAAGGAADGYHQTTTLTSTNTLNVFFTFMHRVYVTGSTTCGPYLAGKATTLTDGTIIVPYTIVSGYQPTMFFVGTYDTATTTEHYVQSKALTGLAAYSSRNTNCRMVLPGSWLSSDGRVATFATSESGFVGTVGSAIGVVSYGVAAVSVAQGRTYSTTDLSYVQLFHAAAAESMYLSGGFLGMFDGAKAVEAGFHLYPEVATVAAGSATPGPDTGTHQVCAVFEWIDNRGRRHQSAPSPAISFSSDGGHYYTITVTCLPIGWRASSTYIGIYATVAGGTTFYRLSPVAGATGSVANSTTASSATYTYATTDANLAIGEILYSPNDSNGASGTLFNDSPPACRVIASNQGRVWLAGLEDPYEYRWSQREVPGVGLQWSDQFSGRIPQGYGELTGIGFVDDKVVLFTPTRKFVITGDGPDETGKGSFSEPTLLPSDTGCVNQRSLLSIPDVTVGASGTRSSGGLAYQSKHGLYLLDRALVDTFFGSPVETPLVGATIVGAVLLENRAQARWYVSSDADSSACVYNYDILFDQWSRLTSLSSHVPRAAAVYNGLPVFMDSFTRYILTETPGVYTDYYGDGPNRAVVGIFQTAWLNVGAIAGFQRVWRWLLTCNISTLSTITVAAFADFSTNYFEQIQFSATTTTPGTGLQMIRHHLAQQKLSHLSIKVTDYPVTDSGLFNGAAFSAITLEVGAKRGARKAAPTTTG